ncbi:hypothetical protein LP419_17650 [Massilia sp. H-1]|nr:hypothetical protein LP419_17650 [Massilia sp. H-1]
MHWRRCALGELAAARTASDTAQHLHMGHILDRGQRAGVEDFQQAGAVVERDRAAHDIAAGRVTVLQHAALLGPHAQHFARIVEDDADLDLAMVDDRDLVRTLGRLARRGRRCGPD